MTALSAVSPNAAVTMPSPLGLPIAIQIATLVFSRAEHCAFSSDQFKPRPLTSVTSTGSRVAIAARYKSPLTATTGKTVLTELPREMLPETVPSWTTRLPPLPPPELTKLAVTFLSLSITMLVRIVVSLKSPLQPLKRKPASAIAVSETTAPSS